ncbi:hypothetical protein HPB49_026020 [Dermacentor silvarum]|nr:hypothetical protein HPB49_026020 [Dermacentor silvarum]
MRRAATTLAAVRKQRVSLARAAYHQCSIYVLDDPLSALDPQVGSKVFRKLLGKNGMLRDKTRLLVTNQGYLLKHADQLFLMCGKTGVLVQPPFRAAQGHQGAGHAHARKL